MSVKVDFVGVSFDIVWTDKDEFKMFPQNDMSNLRGIVPDGLMWNASVQGSYVIHRKPYKFGAQFPQGFSVFWGGQSTILVEVSGRGCSQVNVWEWLASLQNGVINKFRLNKVTRLDLASDYETDLTPFEMVSKLGINPRIKTRNVQNSKTGQTFYVGSRKSDRFCRVYSYNRPHPRAGLVRVEFQFNKGVAGTVVRQILDGDAHVDTTFHSAVRATFENSLEGDMRIPVRVTREYERTDAGTLVWIHSQVVPALATMVQKGEITLDELVKAVQDRLV